MTAPTNPPNVAIVHDWLTGFAGMEQVLLALHSLYPQAPIYTSIYNPQAVPQFKDAYVISSYLQKIPAASSHHQVLIPLMPQAFESFDLKEYDIVFSNTTGMAKGVLTQPGQRHICYCHTPPRYLWRFGGDNRNEGRFDSGLRNYVSHHLRIWDVVSAERPDEFYANSNTTKQRVEKIYRREAGVLFPPVNTDKFILENKPRQNFYLSVGRLVEYKRVDLLIAACLLESQPLKIVGTGPELATLQKLANGSPLIEFMGRLPDQELQNLYSTAKAFLFPAEEDFGIVPVEAMSAGCPVIAFGVGGATDSVVEGKTGTFFMEQTATALAEKLATFDSTEFSPEQLRKHAQTFDASVFTQRVKGIVEG